MVLNVLSNVSGPAKFILFARCKLANDHCNSTKWRGLNPASTFAQACIGLTEELSEGADVL